MNNLNNSTHKPKTSFSEIREVLLTKDEDITRERMRCADDMGRIKKAAGVSTALFSFCTLTSFNALKSRPLLGTFLLLSTSAASLFSREAYVISKNLENLSGGDLSDRIKATESSRQLVNTALNGSWVVSPFYERKTRQILEEKIEE